jgi:sugar phosphate isomerase/epimerase
MSNVTADRLVKAYIKIREARQALSKQDAELEEKQDLIQSKLLEICKETGAESLRTEFGTVTRRVSKKYWTHDWDSFYKFVKEHNAFPLLQKRISVTAMAEFLEEYPDLHPPGLNVDSSYAVSVRRKS